MSLPRPPAPGVKDAAPNVHRQQTPLDSGFIGSSSWRRRDSSSFQRSVHHQKGKVEESDEELFTVPDVEAPPPIFHSTNSDNNAKSNVENNDNIIPEVQLDSGFPPRSRRGRNPVDKEYRRLKRLLRNRVSAQQARERKKIYVNDLEVRAKELQDHNCKLEEKISTLINENAMLRKVLMNTRPKIDESEDHGPKS